MTTTQQQLRTMFTLQVAAMAVPPAPDLATLAYASQHGWHDAGARPGTDRRWLMGAAAVALVGLGGVALAQRRTPEPAGTGTRPADGAPVDASYALAPTTTLDIMTGSTSTLPAWCGDVTGTLVVASSVERVITIANSEQFLTFSVHQATTCEMLDPAQFTFRATTDDPSIAHVVTGDDLPMATTTVATPAPTTTAVLAVPPVTQAGDQPAEGIVLGWWIPGIVHIVLLTPGTTVLRVTVTDLAGTRVGEVAVPIEVLPEGPLMATTTIPATTITTIELP